MPVIAYTVKDIAEAIRSFGETHRRDEYLLIRKWIHALKTGGYENVEFELKCTESTKALELLARAFRH